ncbi:alpha/beta hydrolase family protein [Alteromonas oceanisediminis]|uniref:alpha/beta hydrolase family protein n=1 Tax=Alteromonas oceanisediminis TaxID=2836180 RepID=UPI001BD96ABB|nr:alpha/beta fold hydrolase [Alteromonas oceanisediminis]MBT0587665.1 alpha/beta fold hydrolase [Alteromonas oceanisediminis]
MKYAVAALYFFTTSLLANENLVNAFAQMPQVESMQISPDGQRLAYKQFNKGNYAIVIQGLAGSEKPVVFAVNEGDIRGLRWVSDERMMFSLSIPYFNEAKQMWVTLFRTALLNAQTGEAYWPFTGERYRYNVQSAQLVHTLPKQPDAILVSNYYRAGARQPQSIGLFKINLSDGSQTLIKSFFSAESEGYRWIVDDEGELLGYQQFDDNSEQWQTQWRDIETDDYSQATIDDKRDLAMPQIISVKGETAYILSRSASSTLGLYSVPLNDLQGKPTPLVTFDTFDTYDAYRQDLHTGKLVGVSAIRDHLEHFFVFDEPLQKVYADLVATFPDSQIEITSYSRDRNRYTLRVSGGGFAPQYFFYDQKAGELSLLGKSYPRVSGEMLGRTQAFNFEASDGKTIYGYLTLPQSTAEKSELLVLPHGGPHRRDDAAFDWLRDFFVANGYAVYQPNFRGSEGYGSDYEEAGIGEWGQRMQQDVYEGTRAVMESGKVASKKPCILGHSYGGYVAMMAAVEAQSLYRCALSSAGVSNLKHLIQIEEIKGADPKILAQHYIKGDDVTAKLNRVSPELLGGKHTLPLMLLHGERDTVVRVQHSKNMYAQLANQGNNDALLLIAPSADHWFTQSSTRQTLLEESLAFLQQH